MSKWNLSFDSSSCEEVSEQFINLSHLKVDDVHEKNFWDHPYSPPTLLTLGVPGVENHDTKFGTNYSSSPSLENLYKESKGKKRRCGEDLVSEFDANNGRGMTSRRNEDGLQQYSKARFVEMHNMSERRRRNRIAKKMKVLEELIPNCNKSDIASVLDQAIQYIQALQHQVQVMSMNRICASTLGAGRNQIMQSTQHFNPYMPIMPRIDAVGYFFGFGKSINYSNMFSSNFPPMLSAGNRFSFLPLAVADNLLHPMPIMEAFTRSSPSVAAPEKGS